MNIEEAKNLSAGDIIYQVNAHNSDGSKARWRVNGKVKTWIKSPDKVRVPIKHGLYDYGYLTEKNLNMFTLTE